MDDPDSYWSNSSLSFCRWESPSASVLFTSSTLDIFPCSSSYWASSCFVIPSIVQGSDPWQGWACLGKSPITSNMTIMKRFLMMTTGQSLWWMAFCSLVSRANDWTCIIYQDERYILIIIAISKKTDLKLVIIALGQKTFISVFKFLYCRNDYNQIIFQPWDW